MERVLYPAIIALVVGTLNRVMQAQPTRKRPRTRRSLHDFEEAFKAEAARERARLAEFRKDASKRTRRRRREQSIRKGRMRFALLVASMIATAVIVTVVMLNTLAWLLG